MTSERRYERLRPDEMERLVAAAPVAWVPIGPMEFHGPHLPFGVDAFEAHGLCCRTAELAGGVVLPASYVASGTLDLPFTLDFSPATVELTVAATIDTLAGRGFRVVVVLTGHGPLDLNHMLKRVAGEAEQRHTGLRVYALCWLELNAAGMAAPDEGEPTVVDHAALVETSWMLHLEPDLVDVQRLADDPDASHVGVYGRNPRFTASEGFGAAQIDAATALLAQRVQALLDGAALDPLADLRRFVELSWPERPTLAGRAGDRQSAAVLLHNPSRASRYLSGLQMLRVDGRALDAAEVTLVNQSPGETGVPVSAAALGPEKGFYVRRGQTATMLLDEPVAPGEHRVELMLGLGGVSELALDEVVVFS